MQKLPQKMEIQADPFQPKSFGESVGLSFLRGNPVSDVHLYDPLCLIVLCGRRQPAGICVINLSFVQVAGVITVSYVLVFLIFPFALRLSSYKESPL